ncbi:MAG: hypothetical protein ACLTC4_16115 [Hungatella hathewayi]|uniref:Uncharacterized protein n=1 Tax=Hungatella hathewayi WAL-18680 TaxID=742737 RepID=G5IE44_9FIRM|nr:hypothetical protein [Hungatella hathewayi]EHI60242.1 hypothetical protein HMPREF9473_01771 [ [Hungatella hathewayi WAL-18680]
MEKKNRKHLENQTSQAKQTSQAEQSSQTGQASQKRQGRARRRVHRRLWYLCLACAGGLAIVLLGASVCMDWDSLRSQVRAQIDIQPDQNAKSGTLHAGEMQEIAAGDFWVVMNQLPTLEEGSISCNIEYENPESNHYSARVSLYLKEDGKLLGSTRRVDPGSYVESISLERELAPGEHPVTVRLELFEKKTPVAEMSIDITLRVKGGSTS